MTAKKIALAYKRACEIHEASFRRPEQGFGAYTKDWQKCANEATQDKDIAFIVYMATAGGYADWDDWANEVLARGE